MSRKDKSSDGERLRQASVEENPDDKLFLNSHAGNGEPIDFIVAQWFSFVLVVHEYGAPQAKPIVPKKRPTRGEHPVPEDLFTHG